MMDKKVLLVVMDGVGISKSGIGDAIKDARMPIFDSLLATYPNTKLVAHGQAVGLPDDTDMGNSEVGHNTLGCGQIYAQGAKLVNESILSGRMFRGNSWIDLINNVIKKDSTLHFLGLLSDGNVHSNIAHLFAMLKQAKTEGIKKARIHILLDGRDVPALSALEYINSLEDFLASINDDSFDAAIASGGGRMKITMDRYMANWQMVEAGYNIHVHGLGRMFDNATTAIEVLRLDHNCIDQDLPGFVIGKNGEAIGRIADNDSVILFNFRGDRAIEISMAFDFDGFTHFNRGKNPDIMFAGLLQYDGDLALPKRYLVSPPEITNTLTEELSKHNIKEYAISETQKFGHVTYFWNGNKSEKIAPQLEVYEEIRSDTVPFEERPWMKSAEITDRLLEVMEQENYRFIRCNYPNGDMVGHTGKYEATIISLEALDIALERLIPKAIEKGYTVLLTADHGNADEMFEKNKKGELQIRTAHSLNPVPFIVCDNTYTLKEENLGLANVASTVCDILGIKPNPVWHESIIKSK